MTNKNPSIRNLILVGNGFDAWQGLDTSYDHFRRYYTEHQDEIMKKLHIKKKHLIKNGVSHTFSDVELIYGDPFEPFELESDFWNEFEASLERLDSESINLFFGKDKKGLREMKKSIRRAQAILREAFCSWIKSISIDEKESGYEFGADSVCINFNYTDTLKKRFRVANEIHIHGEADDPESIIFGHSGHPHMATLELPQFGGRFLGLYLIEEILYETDKQVDENIQLLCMDLAASCANAEDIEDIYVLGHSFGPADLGYFEFLMDAMSVHDPQNTKELNEVQYTPIDYLEDLHLRIQYAIHRYGEHSEISKEEAMAVARRYQLERDELAKGMQKEFFKQLGIKQSKSHDFSAGFDENAPVKTRRQSAKWHISYHTDKDKHWIEMVMKELRCSNYVLYPTIDECIGSFNTKTMNQN